jgi:acetyltransferase-like isoleucine patch superfamily enzyme
VIKPGTVLGTPGFGYVAGPAGPARIPHVGGCRLGDDVEIGSNCTVDRGSIEDTVIGAGSKLDNLVHIGHNARLGARCLVMGGSVIAGSADIGDDVVIAGHAAVGGHFRVCHSARIGAKSGVISAVPDATDVSGFPARPHWEFLRAQAALYRLARITAARATGRAPPRCLGAQSRSGQPFWSRPAHRRHHAGELPPRAGGAGHPVPAHRSPGAPEIPATLSEVSRPSGVPCWATRLPRSTPSSVLARQLLSSWTIWSSSSTPRAAHLDGSFSLSRTPRGGRNQTLPGTPVTYTVTDHWTVETDGAAIGLARTRAAPDDHH